jgi:hypothetical protein
MQPGLRMAMNLGLGLKGMKTLTQSNGNKQPRALM